MKTRTHNSEKIANLTQHRATAEQIADGVVDLKEEEQEQLKELLTFSEPPSYVVLERRACEVGEMIAGKYSKAMIGGAPYFMSPLEERLESMGIEVLYSFSKRESQEIPQEDGTVKKIAVFRHVGFVKRSIEIVLPDRW